MPIKDLMIACRREIFFGNAPIDSIAIYEIIKKHCMRNLDSNYNPRLVDQIIQFLLQNIEPRADPRGELYKAILRAKTHFMIDELVLKHDFDLNQKFKKDTTDLLRIMNITIKEIPMIIREYTDYTMPEIADSYNKEDKEKITKDFDVFFKAGLKQYETLQTLIEQKPETKIAHHEAKIELNILPNEFYKKIPFFIKDNQRISTELLLKNNIIMLKKNNETTLHVYDDMINAKIGAIIAEQINNLIELEKELKLMSFHYDRTELELKLVSNHDYLFTNLIPFIFKLAQLGNTYALQEIKKDRFGFYQQFFSRERTELLEQAPHFDSANNIVLSFKKIAKLKDKKVKSDYSIELKNYLLEINPVEFRILYNILSSSDTLRQLVSEHIKPLLYETYRSNVSHEFDSAAPGTPIGQLFDLQRLRSDDAKPGEVGKKTDTRKKLDSLSKSEIKSAAKNTLPRSHKI